MTDDFNLEAMMPEGLTSEAMMPMDPPPDEDAWEAYLNFTLNLLEADGSNAASNETVQALEDSFGQQLPIEVALLLLIGVPDGEAWHRWGDDPAAELAAWHAELGDSLVSASPEAASGYSTAPRLLPIYQGFAVPVTAAEGHASADSNPVFAIEAGNVSVAANDLAAWMHKQFDTPLPWWPDTPNKRFLFWTDLAV